MYAEGEYRDLESPRMTGKFRSVVLALAGTALIGLAGCATTSDIETEPHDPYESFNRSMFAFNKGLDEAILAPVAHGYMDLTPAPVREAVYNFFQNLGYVTTVVNQLLQGKIERGMDDAGRLIINSTFGLGGLVDFASAIDMPKHEEDFDQTLAVWGVESGPYLELPLLGPNTVRSVPGLAADTATNPLTWLGSSPLDYAASALKAVDKRAQFDSAIKLRDKSALDPYVFQREAYLQRRRYLIYDGNPPLNGPSFSK
jgi:phospholipid-binding lipoprotein MlaA